MKKPLEIVAQLHSVIKFSYNCFCQFHIAAIALSTKSNINYIIVVIFVLYRSSMVNRLVRLYRSSTVNRLVRYVF